MTVRILHHHIYPTVCSVEMCYYYSSHARGGDLGFKGKSIKTHWHTLNYHATLGYSCSCPLTSYAEGLPLCSFSTKCSIWFHTLSFTWALVVLSYLPLCLQAPDQKQRHLEVCSEDMEHLKAKQESTAIQLHSMVTQFKCESSDSHKFGEQGKAVAGPFRALWWLCWVIVNDDLWGQIP